MHSSADLAKTSVLSPSTVAKVPLSAVPLRQHQTLADAMMMFGNRWGDVESWEARIEAKNEMIWKNKPVREVHEMQVHI